ncbi:serine hydrolase domain-containing protein [Streptacidiphilus sp. EB103A]|uniref:serine hydrolase domain-containing protein n=1 Tax=Streptacidiphilus sp. EB103A TaxID=3156275 RepID=UPI0035195612
MNHDLSPDLSPDPNHSGWAPGRRSVLGLLGAVAASGVLASSGTADAAAADDSSGSEGIPATLRPGGELDRLIAQLAAEDKFSGTVLLLHRGRRVLARSYGAADRQRGIPNGPDTVFALGSVTKLLTAVAVAQLVQQGRLAYQETLGNHLDGFPADVADTVTLHQLLTHTSGMGDYMQSAGFWAAAAGWTSAEQVMDGTLEFVRKAPLAFAPGTGHLYSNSGYHTLGTIVAEVSGQSYYDYVRRHIFGPAGMTSSDFYTTTQWREDRRIAVPYRTQPSGPRVDAIDQQIFIGSPAGNSFSDTEDLVRFTQALLGGKLLDGPHTQLTVGPKVPRPPLPPVADLPGLIPFEAYGPSAFLVGDAWAVGHNGGAPGISTDLEWYPDSDWVAVTLSNYDAGTTAPIDSLARKLITQA